MVRDLISPSCWTLARFDSGRTWLNGPPICCWDRRTVEPRKSKENMESPMGSESDSSLGVLFWRDDLCVHISTTCDHFTTSVLILTCDMFFPCLYGSGNFA